VSEGTGGLEFGPGLHDRIRARLPESWTTRFAPAPTGWLHLGHAVNAVYVWGLARAFGGRVLLRIEDHDRGRCRAEFERGIVDDLDWLGLVPDAGGVDGERPPLWRQSDRGDAYASALAALGRRDGRLVYACSCSRRQVAADVPDEFGQEARYPGTCRQRSVDADATPARRVVLESQTEMFDDLTAGPQAQDPQAQCGDVLVRDRSGNWTYQFAVVVDDFEQGIDVVIRGRDILRSTGRQIQLARLLGRARLPAYLHHPLVCRPDGTKLSKSDGDTGLRDLRAAGWLPERVLGHAAMLAGLQPEARALTAQELPELFVSIAN
jgi:glutamyl-tRNA synthetase/glutamyl-Q tRNA(Asp) synthetase